MKFINKYFYFLIFLNFINNFSVNSVDLKDKNKEEIKEKEIEINNKSDVAKNVNEEIASIVNKFEHYEEVKKLEHFEKILIENLILFVGLDSLNGKNVYDYLYTKTNKLNFKEASCLYILSAIHSKYIYHKEKALERMYSLCPDPRFSEIILWNLGIVYEDQEKYYMAAEMFSHFRRLFPGSRFYWTARIKEIKDTEKSCFRREYDTQQMEHLINLCKQYIIDANAFNQIINIDVLYIMHEAHLDIFLKEISIVEQYLNKHVYMRTESSIFSAYQRIMLFSDIINSALENNYTYIKDEKDTLYKDIFNKSNDLILAFTNKHPINLPQGKDFKILYDNAIQYIKCNKSLLIDDMFILISEIEKKINQYKLKKRHDPAVWLF